MKARYVRKENLIETYVYIIIYCYKNVNPVVDFGLIKIKFGPAAAGPVQNSLRGQDLIKIYPVRKATFSNRD